MYPGYKMTLGGSAPRGPPEKQRAPRKAEAPDGHWMVGGRGGVPGRGPGLAGGQQAAATSAVGRLGGRGRRPPGMGTDAVRRRMGGGVVAPGGRRPGGQ